MKKIKWLSVVCLIAAFSAINTANAQSPDRTNSGQLAVTQITQEDDELKAMEASQAKDLNERLVEINAMDKSDLTRSEKAKLREETRSIRSQLRTLGGGVYITAGGIIIILLLLILLF